MQIDQICLEEVPEPGHVVPMACTIQFLFKTNQSRLVPYYYFLDNGNKEFRELEIVKLYLKCFEVIENY